MSEALSLSPEPKLQTDEWVSDREPIPELRGSLGESIPPVNVPSKPGRKVEVQFQLVTGSPEWREKAACLNLDTNLFFPSGDGEPAQEQIAKAKRVCGRCAVRAECLEFAVINRQDAGIWGGKTEEERRSARRLKVRQKRTKSKTESKQ